MAEYSIPQASIVPSLFIGLGGTGSRTVERIATRAMGLPHWETHLKALTQFVGIDTSASDQGKLRKISTILVGAFDKERTVANYRAANDLRALQWLDSAYEPRSGGTDGAGQIRVESRLGFHFSSPQIRAKLSQLISTMLEANNSYRRAVPAQVHVYIYAGLGGGTGSGSFLPVSYLIQDIIRGFQWEPKVLGHFILSTLMVKKVDSDLQPDIHANTYAALKELEYMTRLAYPSDQAERPAGEQFVFWNDDNNRSNLPVVKNRPFHLSLIVDRSAAVELPPDIDTVLGDASFLQLFSPVSGRISAELDNYDKHLKELTLTPGKLKDVARGYTKHFGAFGVAALVLPAFELLEYCSLRFAAEALRQQVTFGKSAASSSIDAKLADLRVNYDDPMFNRRSTEERQAAVNRSFVLSMQAMAEEDAHDEIFDGVWYKLVEGVDTGKLTGEKDAQGKEQRTETLKERVLRTLQEERTHVVADISIPSPNMLGVQPESLGNYNDIFSKFDVSIASANRKVEDGKERLKSSAKQGDCIERMNPRLEPLQERYLVIRLLEHLDSTAIPEAAAKLTTATTKSYNNPKIKEKYNSENVQSLNDAAHTRKMMIMKDRAAFESVRDSIQDDFRQTAVAQKNYYDADLRLSQFRSLRDYLAARARQYADLATDMNTVVSDLEHAADEILQGVAVDQPRYSMSVEIFETMDAPKRRLWRQVFDELFVKGGRGQSTFDRQKLATSIAAELRPVQDRATGKFKPKPVDVIKRDLKEALKDLGRKELRAAIYGDESQSGLTIESGLELEARIVLGSAKEEVTDEEVSTYIDHKLRSFQLLTGVYARLSVADAASMDDGVKMARTRNVVLQEDALTPRFVEKVRGLMLREGREPQFSTWGDVPDQHLVIAHDMDLPIPLYYFNVVVGELEAAYERVSASRRSYNLHIDYRWEETLANLNPARNGVSTSWAMDTLLSGLLYSVVVQTGEGWLVQDAGGLWPEDRKTLGKSLSAALYRLGEYHRAKEETLRQRFTEMIRDAQKALPPEQQLERMTKLRAYIEAKLLQFALKSGVAESTVDYSLDPPIWKMFKDRLDVMLRDATTARPTQTQGSPVGLLSL